ncbi:YciI family protein [Myxococcus sp. K15C18031901]|uniref:YciI family protein n=1 Tax=Myxococcus dinghuensis TaxID=2906761 RepID=UPI0020A79C29|nr:YciI family protein [Myxococcus dinghuensis]MCP3100470.1 YciI family protein [Myxococcus dinghuensis]
MRVMVFVKATPHSETGAMPTEEMFAEMGRYNEQLVKAGIMLAAEGLQPSSKGKRVVFQDGKKPSVLDGPFTETKELIAGYWLWQVRSMEEALEWARRCPNPMPGQEGVIEIRPVYDMADLGETFTPELRAQEEGLRAQMEQRQKAT